ncbi:MAG TPA: methyltransferase domain-containing protein [Chloroflexota bacterium]|nr:methyltransferase domain-containing protein [Chloroflexota bacterium]
MGGYPDDVARNRRHWEATSDQYQETHFADLPSRLNDTECKWGVWGVSENRLQVLGDVRGKDVLELGCGGAFWSIRLAKQGARPVGLDFSSGQLAYARRLMAIAKVDFPEGVAGITDISPNTVIGLGS